jgi:hypothetical protein
MTPRRLLLPTTTPDSDKRGSHRRKKVPRSAVRDGSTTGEGEQESNQKKRKRITPSPSPPPTVRFPDSNELDRLVPSITQSPLASSAVAVGQSPRRSPRLLDKVKAPSIRPSNVLLSVKSKQKVLGFKLDNTTIHAWFRKDLELFSAANASSLKSKAQNNFQTNLQRKPNQVKADPGKSQRIAEQSQPDKPTNSNSKPPPVVVPPSVPSKSTMESNSSKRRLLEDFLFSDVGDTLLLQIALDHPLCASCSALCKHSGPKPLRTTLGHTFVQTPCVVTLHSC